MMEYFTIRSHIDLYPLKRIQKNGFFIGFPKNITLKILGQGTSEYEFTKNYLFLQWLKGNS